MINLSQPLTHLYKSTKHSRKHHLTFYMYHGHITLRPCLYVEKLSRVERSPPYLSYPGRANFSYISLQNLVNRLHEKQKVGLARSVTLLAERGMSKL